ncbi:beta-lactamase/transpeptidase-like protein [Linnemannia elongata]|nr:beta-lactamase/transpeptidase-like protein [Linnemannia elongata]
MAPLLSKSALLFLLLSPLTQGACISRGSHSSRVQDSNGFDVADATANGNHRSFIENLPAVLEKARIEGGIPGMAVAIMHKGHIVFAQGFGKRNSKDPFTAETVSHIASMTKAFTATAVGELVAEGKVDWDITPVSQYLPEFQLKDPVLTSQLTFADLLSHRTPFPEIDVAWFRNKQPRRELIKQLRYLDMPSKLPREVNYNNVMYGVAGEAAANVAGMSYPELMRTKIFDPLGLKDAGLSHPEMAKRPNYAMPYHAATFEDARNGIYEEGYIDTIPMSVAPAGDIYMNVLDLVKWGRVILKEGELDGKQVLDKASVQETLKSQNNYLTEARQPGFAPTIGYGFGWDLDSYKGHAIMHHGGANPGYRSMIAFFPNDDLVVSILTNTAITELPTSLPYYIADGLLNIPQTVDWLNDQVLNRTKYIYDLYDEVENDNLPDRIEGKPHSHALVDYTGEYTHPVFGKIVVTLQDDGSLFMKVREFESKLEHYHYESFKGYVQDFAIRGNVFFTFFTGSDGGVESVEASLVLSPGPEVYKKTKTSEQ